MIELSSSVVFLKGLYTGLYIEGEIYTFVIGGWGELR